MDRAFSPREIEVFAQRPVAHFHVRHVNSPSAMRLTRERDGVIAVFSPRMRPGPTGQVPPAPRELERRQEAERAQLQEQQRAEQLRRQERFRAERTAKDGRLSLITFSS